MHSPELTGAGPLIDFCRLGSAQPSTHLPPRLRFIRSRSLFSLCLVLAVAPLIQAVVIPDGWDDAPYVERGKQHQTNLLYLKITGNDPVSGDFQGSVILSATYLNEYNVITAAHGFQYFPSGSQLSAELLTGSNSVTNRGASIPAFSFTVHPEYDPGRPGETPDIAILHLAKKLPGPSITITNAVDGEVVSEAGFGYSGSSATGLTYDRNSRGWDAPVENPPSSYPAPYYRATAFYPYIPLNGKGANRDSGGPVSKAGNPNQLIGIGMAQAGGMLTGSTIYLDLSHPIIKGWIDQHAPSGPPAAPILNSYSDGWISISGEPNRIYGIEASTNLANWVEIGEATNKTGTATFRDREASTVPSRFYRAVVK